MGSWTHSFQPVTWVSQGEVHARGCGAPQISAAARPGTWPRADQAQDRKPFQVPGPAQGREEELGTLFFDILRRTRRVSCSGDLGRWLSMSVRCKAKSRHSDSSLCGMQ